MSFVYSLHVGISAVMIEILERMALCVCASNHVYELFSLPETSSGWTACGLRPGGREEDPGAAEHPDGVEGQPAAQTVRSSVSSVKKEACCQRGWIQTLKERNNHTFSGSGTKSVHCESAKFWADGADSELWITRCRFFRAGEHSEHQSSELHCGCKGRRLESTKTPQRKFWHVEVSGVLIIRVLKIEVRRTTGCWYTIISLISSTSPCWFWGTYDCFVFFLVYGREFSKQSKTQILFTWFKKSALSWVH